MNSSMDPTPEGSPPKTAPPEETAPTIKAPPTTLVGILRSLGPGLIIAGSIVGSGELIATTTTGAEAGFSLLWLIVIGCVIKVFVQVELGRYTIVTGTTTISGLSSLPGPKLGGAHPIVWFWFIMFIAIMFQLGGIVGGVGQALSINFPLTERGGTYNSYREAETRLTVIRATVESPEVSDEVKSSLVTGAPKTKDTSKTPGLAELQSDSITNYLKLQKGKLSKEQSDRLDQLATALTAMARAPPGSNEYRLYNEILPRADLANWVKAEAQQASLPGERANAPADAPQRSKNARQRLENFAEAEGIDATTFLASYVAALAVPPARNRLDTNAWTIILTVLTIILLVRGRYGFIQTFSTTLVGLFTLVTIVNVLGLQTVSNASAWSITVADVREGLSFGLPEGDWKKALATALATFGIIGVGAAELIAYPYWCMEQGYARFTGPRDDSDQWAQRARGWMRVLRWDAWCSMVVYTFATVAFYLLGAAILGRIHLVPAGDEMVRSLGVMYQPVFGDLAKTLFLFGAFAVLYSTFFVATAGNARMVSDVFRTLGFVDKSEQTYRKNVRLMCAVLPAICATTSVLGFRPVVAVLASGTMQAIMLPMVAAAAIYFRYKKSDPRVTPGRAWDVFLIVSAIGMLVAGGYAAYDKLRPYLSMLFE